MLTMETFHRAVVEKHEFITNFSAKQDIKGRFHQGAVNEHKKKPK